jgi:CheY-like chemotaxis protein
MEKTTLFWSRSGEVACDRHAPETTSPEWVAGGWQRIPGASDGMRARYQCQQCTNGRVMRTKKVPASPMILNVDDRPEQLYARDRLLRLHGFTVTNADSVASAYDTAIRIKPNLVLLDIHMPDGDGRELCQRLKQESATAHIPVVLISASVGGQVNLLESIRWGGADAFLKEPVEPESMVSTLRRVLRAA